MNKDTNKDTLTLSRRLWQKDLSLWQPALDDPGVAREISRRLGWLDVFDWLPGALPEVVEWADKIAQSGRFKHVVVLGMGGSSLAPLVFSSLFAPREGYPVMSILDSTSPDMVAGVAAQDVAGTLFIVASKSGTTLETMDLYRFMFDQVGKHNDRPGEQFVAITDSGSWLENHARETGFCRVFLNPEEIGGRYSALSLFGLVPAALHGIDVMALTRRGAEFARASRQGTDNSAEQLGLMMADQALAGRDKMLLSLSPALSTLGAWIEQLVAESTGKQGVGVLPVCMDHQQSIPGAGDTFRVRISLGPLASASDDSAKLAWELGQPLDIGAEFFRWEFATAIAASKLGINPFDQPNVAEAKQSTSRFISGEGKPEPGRQHDTGHFTVEWMQQAGPGSENGNEINLPVAPQPGNYIALLAYLPIQPRLVEALEALRRALAEKHRVVSTLGFGPRYLHSTGQLHKGGKPDGIFLVFSDAEPDAGEQLAVPGRDYSFNSLIDAQANGDQAVLAEHRLPVMRVRLKGDRLAAIKAFATALLHG